MCTASPVAGADPPDAAAPSSRFPSPAMDSDDTRTGRAMILVLDFDGTLTTTDVGDDLCDRFAPPGWRDVDQQWVRGELSLPEAQRRMWGMARATRAQALDGARAVGRLRPGLDALLDAAEARGV